MSILNRIKKVLDSIQQMLTRSAPSKVVPDTYTGLINKYHDSREKILYSTRQILTRPAPPKVDPGAYSRLINKYRRAQEHINHAASAGRLEEAIALCERECPPKALFVAQKTPAARIQDFSRLSRELVAFKNVMQRINHLLTNALAKAATDDKTEGPDPKSAKELHKRLLKVMQQHIPDMEPALQHELARLLTADDEIDPYWLQFCLSLRPPVSGEAGKGAKLPMIPKKWESTVRVDASGRSLATATPLDIGTRTMLKLVNTQAALSGRNELAGSLLNLARLEAGTTETLSANETTVSTDQYIEWLMEKALGAGLALEAEDTLIVAHAKFAGGHYGEVIEIAQAQIDQAVDAKSYPFMLLLGLAHHRLWQAGDSRGDLARATELLEVVRQHDHLGPVEQFVLCQLLVEASRTEDMRVVFSDLDLTLVQQDPETVMTFARRYKLLDLAETYLLGCLDKEKESQLLWSCYCELSRHYKGQLANSRKAITALEEINPQHPWVLLQKCHDHLDATKIDSAQRLLQELPDEDFWKEEKALLNCRISMGKGDLQEAGNYLEQTGSTEREDRTFLKATLLANQGEFTQALQQIPLEVADDHWIPRFAALKARLLVRLERFDEAEEATHQAQQEAVQSVIPWIYLGLTDYDRLLESCQNLNTVEALFLMALAREKMGDGKAALIDYRKFLEKVRATHGLSTQAVQRGCKLCLELQDYVFAEWLLAQSALARLLAPKTTVELLALCDNWQQVASQLLAQSNGSASDNLVFSVATLLKQHSAKGDWGQCENLLERLTEIDSAAAASLRREVTAAKAVDMIRNARHGETLDFHETSLPDAADLYAKVRMVIEGRLDLPAFTQVLNMKGLDYLNDPRLALLVVVLQLSGSRDGNGIVTGELLDCACSIEDADLNLVASALSSLVDEGRNLALDQLRQRKPALEAKLPMEKDPFWTRLGLTFITRNPDQMDCCIDLMKGAENQNPRFISALRAARARQRIQEGKLVEAMQDLEVAVQ